MNPIEILLKSSFDPKGFQEAEKLQKQLSDAIKAGFGIEIGQKIAQAIQKIPEAIKHGFEEGIRFNAMLEQQTIAFGTLLQSATAAQKRVEELFRFAADTPFSFEEVVQADRVLQSLTQGALAGKEGLRLVGDAAAAAAVPFQEAALWIGRLYSGLQSGTPVGLATERLMMMGLISGETKDKLDQLAESGNGVGKAMEIVEQTFAKTAGAMEAQSHTFNGLMSTLNDNVRQLLGLGTKDFFEGFVFWLEKINALMGSQVVSNYVEALRTLVSEIGLKSLASAAGAASAGGNGDPATLKAIADSLSQSIERTLQSKRAAGELDEEEVRRLEKKLNLYKEIDNAAERLQRIQELAANIGRGKALPNAASRGMLPGTSESDVETAFKAYTKEQEKQLDQLKDYYAIQKDLGDQADQAAQDRADRDTDNLKAFADLQKQLDQERLQKQKTGDQADMDALRIKRDELSLKQAKLEADFTRTDLEKRDERIQLIRDEIAAVDKLIQKLTKERDLESDPAARESINQRIASLDAEKKASEKNLIPYTSGPNPYSFGDQFLDRWQRMQEQVGTMAQQSARAFENAWTNALNTTSSGLTNWIMGNATAAEALRSIYVGIVQGIIQEFVKMAVQWVATHVFMAGISSAFHATEVGQHVAAEGAKTAASGQGSVARGAIRLGETLFHAIQLGIRVAAHIAGEIAMTAATVANTAIRAAATLLEAIPNLIVAAFKGAKAVADIPYVGPILAVAAIGAIIAAGLGVLGGGKKGFASGGYTGDGDPSAPAGIVHKGEFVFSAPQTAAIGRSNLSALARGGMNGQSLLSALGNQAAAGAGRVDNSVKIAPVLHPDMVAQWAQSEPGKKFIVDIARGVVLEMQN